LPAGSVTAKNLKYWLNKITRKPNPYTQFTIIDIEEIAEIDDELKDHIEDIILKCRFPDGLLDDIAEYIGDEAITKKITCPNLPTFLSLRRGYFGEALLGEILVQLFEYKIPIQKLQYSIIANLSLPRTDIVVIKHSEEDISELCFVESKLRTIEDKLVAVNAFNQLKKDYSKDIPDLLIWILARLKEKNDPLYPTFLAYMFDTRDTTNKEKFLIGLIYDTNNWSETILSNLDENIDTINNEIIVNLIRIEELALLTDDIYKRIGVIEVIEDE